MANKVYFNPQHHRCGPWPVPEVREQQRGNPVCILVVPNSYINIHNLHNQLAGAFPLLEASNNDGWFG